MKIVSDINYKIFRYYGEFNFFNFLKIFFEDGISANILYRLMQFFRKIKLLPLAFLFYKINQFINGCTIGSGASFGRGFVLAHPLGVVIHGKVVGGKNIMIQSGVVIGAKWSGLPKKVPVLGNNISIGSGAKILGGIKIGNNVNIGANAVVLKDVPDNVTVAGIPARIVKRR